MDVARVAQQDQARGRKAAKPGGAGGAGAVDRANTLLREAETRLTTEFADVDQAIATHHAQQVKAWAGTGGEKPSGDLPKSLIARRQARDKTVEEIGAAKVACKALSNDLDAAKAALAEAECAASEATVPVMLEEADQIATY